MTRAFTDQAASFKEPGEGLNLDRLALRLDMTLQQFSGAQWFLARPLQQAKDGGLVEYARGAAARLVVQAMSIPSRVQILKSCTLATTRLSMFWYSNSKVLACSRARKSDYFLTTCARPSRSCSLSRMSSRLPIKIHRLHCAVRARKDRIRSHWRPAQAHCVENSHGPT